MCKGYRENLVQQQINTSLAHAKAMADITNQSSIMADLDRASDSFLAQDYIQPFSHANQARKKIFHHL